MYTSSLTDIRGDDIISEASVVFASFLAKTNFLTISLSVIIPVGWPDSSNITTEPLFLFFMILITISRLSPTLLVSRGGGVIIDIILVVLSSCITSIALGYK